MFRGLPLQAPLIKANGTTHRVYWREFIVQMCHGTLSKCPRRHCMRKTLAVNTASFRTLVRLTDDCCTRSHAFRISSSRRLLCPVNHKRVQIADMTTVQVFLLEKVCVVLLVVFAKPLWNPFFLKLLKDYNKSSFKI